MCRIYNTVGSMATIKSHLSNNNIHDFKSLREVMDFQKSYLVLRQQKIAHHESLIMREESELDVDLQQLDSEIDTQRRLSRQKLTEEIETLKLQLSTLAASVPKNFFQKLIKELKHWQFNRRLKYKEDGFNAKVEASIRELVGNYQFKNNRYQFIKSNFDKAVEQSAQHSLSELERKKTAIDEINSFIYGALGEQKVVKVLEALSDEYFLINDFYVSFSPAIYNRQENDYIKSVQIDHVLIGPSGIFLIETKNWSEKSLEDLSLRSPVDQIKRASFVLFMLLNNEFSNSYLRLERHHWGNKRISVRNLIVLTNNKTKEDFQYVKILTVSELTGYVNYFKPSFSNAETQSIANFILGLNAQKVIKTR